MCLFIHEKMSHDCSVVEDGTMALLIQPFHTFSDTLAFESNILPLQFLCVPFLQLLPLLISAQSYLKKQSWWDSSANGTLFSVSWGCPPEEGSNLPLSGTLSAPLCLCTWACVYPVQLSRLNGKPQPHSSHPRHLLRSQGQLAFVWQRWLAWWGWLVATYFYLTSPWDACDALTQNELGELLQYQKLKPQWTRVGRSMMGIQWRLHQHSTGSQLMTLAVYQSLAPNTCQVWGSQTSHKQGRGIPWQSSG